MCSAFDELGRGGDDKGSEAGGGACSPDIQEGLRDGGRVAKKFERAIVGYEEDGVEGTVADYGCGRAYATAMEVRMLDM